ncbi:MAG TPA: crosslink repair DNA glycosylase YcaQ family protein, partial [Thermoleophilaceae bacterium]|nr:crosslink repair DNA glycosylase YcaQ family protein [Thermoleophilaceae bacterium]
MQRIEAAERRARLARRHRLAPDQRAATVVEATESMVCLHATDPATVYLSAWARTEGMEIADMDRALYEDRTLVKHLAMRRTLFVFPRATLPAAQAGASNRVADAERRRLAREVERAGVKKDGERWLREASEQ